MVITTLIALAIGAVIEKNIGIVAKAIDVVDGVWDFVKAWAKKLFPKS